MATKSKIVTFRMKEDEYEEIQNIAKSKCLTVSEYIRVLIENDKRGVVENEQTN